MLLLSCAVVASALFFVFLVGPAGLYYDDAGCLYQGKYLSYHPGAIFSFTPPRSLHNSLGHRSWLGEIFWVNYRPFERVVWALCYLLFGPSNILFGILQKLIFLVTVFMLYKIGKLLADPVAGIIAAGLFIFNKIPYGVLTWNTCLALQFGLLFLLLAVFWTIKGFLSQKSSLIFLGVLLATFSFLFRESNIYIYFGIACFYASKFSLGGEKTKFKIYSLLIICATLILCEVFYFSLIFNFNFYSLAEAQIHALSFANIKSNLNFYFGAITSGISISLLLFCAYLFAILRMPLQFTGLAWAIVSLAPLLFSRRTTEIYLMDFFVGFSLFCAAGLSRLYAEWSENKATLKKALFKPSFFNTNLPQIIIIILISFSLICSFINNAKDIFMAAMVARTKFFNRQARLVELKTLGKSGIIYVPTPQAKEFYELMASIYDMKNAGIKNVSSWNEMAGLVGGENLLKNPGFENRLAEWSSIRGTNRPTLVNISETIVFEGKCALIVDSTWLKGMRYDLIDIRQPVKVEPGSSYAFGGWVRPYEIDDGIRIEVQDGKDFRKGFWKTDLISRNKGWLPLFNTFTAPGGCDKVFFYAVRVENFIKGRAYVDNVFMYKLKKPILGYD